MPAFKSKNAFNTSDRDVGAYLHIGHTLFSGMGILPNELRSLGCSSVFGGTVPAAGMRAAMVDISPVLLSLVMPARSVVWLMFPSMTVTSLQLKS